MADKGFEDPIDSLLAAIKDQKLGNVKLKPEEMNYLIYHTVYLSYSEILKRSNKRNKSVRNVALDHFSH